MAVIHASLNNVNCCLFSITVEHCHWGMRCGYSSPCCIKGGLCATIYPRTSREVLLYLVVVLFVLYRHLTRKKKELLLEYAQLEDLPDGSVNGVKQGKGWGSARCGSG